MPLKLPLCALLLGSSTLIGQPFSVERSEGHYHAAANNVEISAQEMKAIPKLADLTTLALGWAPEGVELENGALSVLAECGRLEDLRLAKLRLCDEDLQVLPKMKALRTLWIEGNDMVDHSASATPSPRTNGLTDQSIASFQALENLEELSIRGYGDFSDDFVRQICALPKLIGLEVSSTRFSDRALEIIAANPRLKKLTIRSSQLTDRGIAALARMPTLEDLEIDSPLLTQQSLHAIASIKGLKVLDLPIKEVDREALAVVAGWKAMERLILRRAQIGDTQFEALRGHPGLQSLFLESSTLTEKSRPVLQSLEALSYGEFGRGSSIPRIFKK